MRRRILQVALVAMLGVAATAYGGLEKRLVVEVEGRPVAIRTFAFTVGDALRRAGIPVNPKDRVVPSLDAAVTDGARVALYRAKPVTILLDGKPRRVLVTALTVEEMLEEINLRGSLADFVHPSRAAPVRGGMTITYRRAVALSVVADGATTKVITNAKTVATVLRELGVKVGKRDRIEPAAKTRPRAGMTIRVLRVGDRVEVVHEPIAYDTQKRNDPKLELGLRRVVQEGRAGERMLRYRVTYVDGRAVRRVLLASKVLREPRDKIIAVGRYIPACKCSTGSQTGGASWYGAEGLTAAHRWLPFGTVVRVTRLDTGKTISVVIRDRGPYVGGRVIDLSDDAFRRLAPLGKGIINVKLRW